MCGIAGHYSFTDKSITDLDDVIKAQFVRGPDDGGYYQHSKINFAHRRLKIFDLSDFGSQPMTDKELGLAMVFNGAIYNFPELKNELKGLGYQFKSTSDSEVILKAYHAWGIDAVSRIEGMFAFAIYDERKQLLILARDRMGIKPLYYSHTKGGFKFASTLPALIKFSDVDTDINPQALQYYLMFHMVPEPHTLLKGVNKLEPGTIATIDSKGYMEIKPYWQLKLNSPQNCSNRTEKDWIDSTQLKLWEAIERQLMADVPVGILLSGGLDSSLLVAGAAHQGHRPKTFSIGFESSSEEKGDEFYYSDKVAKFFNTEHYKLFISNTQLTETIQQCISSMSEPMISHDNIGFFLLSKEVSKHVKVALSGQGADELFGGYHWFNDFPTAASTYADSAKLILNKVGDRSYSEYQQIVTEKFKTPELSSDFLTQLSINNGSLSPLDNLLVYESTAALSNGPLARVDNMTMSSSLEARVPFLDEKIVELSKRLPLEYKLKGNGKYILKKIGEKFLPRDVVYRPKGYFPVPILKHINGPVRELLEDTLTARKVKERGLFNSDYVNTLFKNPDKHLTPTGASKLWQIGLLEYWLQQLDL